MDINATLLTSLLEIMKNKNVVEKDCLKSCEINTSFFSDWKAGRLKSPSFDKIYRICQYLDISIDTLIQYDNKPSNQQELLNLYSKLNSHEQKLVLSLVRILCSYK